MNRPLDSLATNTFLAALGLVVLIGVVVLYVQLITLRVYLPVVGAASAGLFGAWWLLEGRRVWPMLSRNDAIGTVCSVLVAVYCFSDICFRVTNAAFGSGARRVSATVLRFDHAKAQYFVIVSMPESPFEAKLSVPHETFASLRTGQPVVVVLHDGLLGDLWCRRDPIERAVARTGEHP